MDQLKLLLVAGLFGSLGIIVVGIVLWFVHRLRGEQLMRAGATGVLATMLGLIAFNVAVRPGVPAWENVAKILAAVFIVIAVPLWKRHRNQQQPK